MAASASAAAFGDDAASGVTTFCNWSRVAVYQTMLPAVQVYILMGQSNMVGSGRIKGGAGSLEHALKERKLYPYLADDQGNWTERKDVRNVRVKLPGGGGMMAFYNEFMTINSGNIGPNIGPEHGIGHHVGHVTDAPVMIIKSCTGNRALGWDLLPPGSESFEFTDANGTTWVHAGYKGSPERWEKGTEPKPIGWYAGKQYDDDTGAVKKALEDLATYYPGAREYEVAGFFWWQGDRDSRSAALSGRYEKNLVHLIKQLRKEFEAPDAKFVCASLGQTRKGATDGGGKILDAMLAVDGDSVEQSVTHALARMITPYCRGLMGWDARFPLWHFAANRPRAGKDYLAGVTHLIYEGRTCEDAPLDRDSEETRKRITAAMMSGRRIMHFANCQGHIQDPQFIGAITSKTFAARNLGSTEAKADLVMPNEIEFSLSANVGLTVREDVEPRTRRIALQFYDENPNGRSFTRPDLHGWVLENRPLLLGAVAALVQHWINQGCPPGPIPFNSFPEWSRVVGGIMTSCGLPDPCQPHEHVEDLGGDRQERAMRAVFRIGFDHHPDAWIEKSRLFELLEAATDCDELTFFAQDGDLSSRSAKVRIGKALRQFRGRHLEGIQLHIEDNTKSERQRVMFARPSSPDPVDLDHLLRGEVGDIGEVHTLQKVSEPSEEKSEWCEKSTLHRESIDGHHRSPQPPHPPRESIFCTDLHALTAAAMQEIDIGEVTKDQRQMAKAINFGNLYGQGDEGLARYARNSYGVDMSVEEAHRFRLKFFKTYPALKVWHGKAWQHVDQYPEWAKTLIGRRRLIPRDASNWDCFTALVNTPIQGSTADGIKYAIVLLSQRLPDDACIVSTVHDELVVECPKQDAEGVRTLMINTMTEAMSDLFPEIPIEVEASIGKSWAEK